MKLKHGDVLICKGKRPLSKAIGKASKSEATHTAVVLELKGSLFAFDAQASGCYTILFDQWEKRWDYDYLVFRPNIVNPDTFTKRAFAYFGRAYDKKHLLFGFWRKLLFKKDVKDKYRLNGKFICSELTMKLATNEINAEDYTPGDVLNYFLNKNLQPIYILGEWQIKL